MDLDHDLDPDAPNPHPLEISDGIDALILDAEEAERNLLTSAQASTTVVPMTSAPSTETLEAALLRAAKAAYSDSNDAEIEALRDALDEATSLLPDDIVLDLTAIDQAAYDWAAQAGLH
jgi:hypothetical protein